jgi:DUF4097 and DUF4098 domain-containing protein YvlB
MKTRLLPLLAFTLLAATSARADDDQFKESFTRSAAFQSTGRVSLQNVNGDISIETWDKNEIRIEGEKFARTEAELERIELTIELSETAADIKVHLPKRATGWFGNNSIRGGVRFKLMVPATADLARIKTVNSSVDVNGARGPAHLETVNGRIRAHNLGGHAKLSTVNGQIDASFVEVSSNADLSFNTVNGSVKLTLPENTGAQLHASVVNGHVDCEFPIEMKGRVGGKRISGKIGDGRAKLSAESVNGSVKINKS